jgi:hypothetical protein
LSEEKDIFTRTTDQVITPDINVHQQTELKIMTRHYIKGRAYLFFLGIAGMISISGCASFGKGIAEAVLDKSNEQDTRVCQVKGKAFDGIEPGLSNSTSKTKVLMVHGVGDRLPGYATEFFEKLGGELNVTAKQSAYRDIKLSSPLAPKKDMGNLRITRLQNEDGTKELLFYELTWSEITRSEKPCLILIIPVNILSVVPKSTT